MIERNQIVPLSQVERLEVIGAGTWNIESMIPDGVDTVSVGIDTELVKRWKDYLLGLGSLTIESAPESAFQGPEAQMKFLGRDLGTTNTLGTVTYSPTEQQLPSSYRRPQGKILINQIAFGESYKKDQQSVGASEAFAQHLDHTVRSGLLDMVTARYGSSDSFRPYERSAGFSPYIGNLLATFAGTGSWIANGIGAALYGVALGADYHDARLALGKDASPSAFKLKRWSLTPCGLPMERHAEMLLRSTALLRANPKPKIVKYVQAK